MNTPGYDGAARTAATEPTKAVPLTCHGHSRPITHLSFSTLQTSSNNPSTNPQYYLISACKDNNPMLRDGLTGDWIGTFIGHKGAVWSSRLSACASLAATGSADFSAKVWDTFTGEQLHSLSHNHIVRAVAFPGAQEKPQILATGGMEKKLRLWDLARAGQSTNTGAATTTDAFQEIGPGEHAATIKSIIWSHTDANLLLTASDDKLIRWFDLRSRSSISSHPVDGLIGSCEMSLDGIDGAPEGTISVAAGKNIYFFHGGRPGVLLGHRKTEQDMASVAVSGSLKRYVTGSSQDTFVRVWDLESGVELDVRKGHHGPVWTTAYSPDGRLHATGSEDGTIKLWKSTSQPYGLWK